MGCTLGASGMMVNDLKCWSAKQDDNPMPWLLIVQLVQHAFETRVVPVKNCFEPE